MSRTLHFHFGFSGQVPSRDAGSQQGSWHPASLTRNTCEDREPRVAHCDSGAALSVLSTRVPVARLKGGVRGLSLVPSLTTGVADLEGRAHEDPARR